jgi:hypothetical protein
LQEYENLNNKTSETSREKSIPWTNPLESLSEGLYKPAMKRSKSLRKGRQKIRRSKRMRKKRTRGTERSQ